ncbi:MAG: ribosomal protein S4e [Haloplasmataceae bacterium]|jgi:RNA-binding protein YlmH|nr:ribosomal protein S4e [Haloplasmataceae bacterium]
MVISDDEKIFYAKVNEYLKQVENNDKIILTKFLSLREQEIITEVFKYSNSHIEMSGGHSHAERKRCLIYNINLTINDSLFNLTCYKILYNKRYLNLTHQNVLGTLMSLKIDRALFGDIIFQGDECYFFVSNEIESILINEFKMINKVPINLDQITEKIETDEKFIKKDIIISSMRIDNLISHVYNLSRNNAQELISNGSVYKNWQVVLSQADKTNIDDVISVRKYGRFIISKLLRSTKSDKLVIEIKIPSN